MGEGEDSSPVETPPVTESPTLVNIRRRDDVWPPKYSSVRYLPKTGFTPTVIGESGQGKKFVWPPPKQGHDSSRNVGQLQHPKVQDAWNPEANALGNRPPPFAPRTAPAKRCTDDVWPPKGSEYQPPNKSSPKPITSGSGRFEDYIKCRSGPSVPPTYRTPPGTQHIQVAQLEGEFVHVSRTRSETSTQSESRISSVQTTVAPPVADRRVVEEEVEYEEEEEEEEEEESEEE